MAAHSTQTSHELGVAIILLLQLQDLSILAGVHSPVSRHGGATSIAGGTVLRFLWQVSNLVKRLKHQDSVLQAFLELFVIYS